MKNAPPDSHPAGRSICSQARLRHSCPQALVPGTTIVLPETVAHHIDVVRLAPGELITLFNGQGGEVQASIVSLAKRSVTVAVQLHIAREVELSYAVTLAQALPETSKMDWIIEKAIELGVSGVQPFASQRCVARLSAERAEQSWRRCRIFIHGYVSRICTNACCSRACASVTARLGTPAAAGAGIDGRAGRRVFEG